MAAPVGLAVDDEFVGVGVESVDGGLGEEWVGHLGEHLAGIPVGGEDRRGASVAFDDDFVDLGGVDGVHRAEREVVDDEHVDAQQFADLAVVAVVQPCGFQPFQQDVGAFEVDAATAADGDVSERGREEGFADPDEFTTNTAKARRTA